MDELEQRLDRASARVLRLGLPPLDGSLDDLERIAAAVAGPPGPRALEDLGVAFGRVIAGQHSSFEWALVDDELALKDRRSSLVLFPLGLFAKRAAAGQRIDVLGLAAALLEDLPRIVAAADGPS